MTDEEFVIRYVINGMKQDNRDIKKQLAVNEMEIHGIGVDVTKIKSDLNLIKWVVSVIASAVIVSATAWLFGFIE